MNTLNTRAPFPPRHEFDDECTCGTDCHLPQPPDDLSLLPNKGPARLMHGCPFGGPDYLIEPWSNPESGIEHYGDFIALEYDDAYGQFSILTYTPSRHD